MNLRLQHLFLICILCLLSINASAQKTINIKKAVGKIQLDGILNEPDWQQAEIANNFWQTLPTDTSAARSQTEVRLTYDQRNLYVSAVCYNAQQTDNYVIQSLKRDFSFPVNDAFALMLDPFYNRTNGINFSVSAAGVQREGTIDNAGLDGVTTAFDTKWFSETKNYGDKWIVEMAIPFKVLRYSDKQMQWGINFARNDLQINETSTWSAVSRQFNVAYLVQEGVLQWDKAPRKTGANVALIPYVWEGLSDNDVTDTEKTKVSLPETGLDAKIGITSSLNMDVTIHPDFAQVEVDAQVTNLDRFNLFFPERRGFFTENSDVFRFGNERMQPFFSRAVGLNAQLLGGVRLTGNLDKRWRLGVMSMQTEGITKGTQSQNYAVATIQRRLLANSNARFFVVNRQAFGNILPDTDDHNTVAGAEFLYRSKNGKWGGDAMWHQTFTNRDGTVSNKKILENAGAELRGSYSGRNWYGLATAEYMGQFYTADVGFLQDLYQRNDQTKQFVRVPYWVSQHNLGYKFYPKQKNKWRSYGPEIGGKLAISRLNEGKIDRYNYLKWVATTQNQSVWRAQVQNYATQLYFPTNITGRMDSLLQPNTYHYTNAGIEYEPTRRNKFYGTFKAYYGGFFGGQRLNLSADATYRLQPWGNLALNVAYNRVQFPAAYNSNTNLLLISPRIELTFSRSVFWTTFVQYNTQIENLNINTRLQWRFAPMSDLYLVLTDNFFAPENVDLSAIKQKNWGLVLKVSYWLGL